MTGITSEFQIFNQVLFFLKIGTLLRAAQSTAAQGQIVLGPGLLARPEFRAQIFLKSLYNQYACFKEWGRWFCDIQPGLKYIADHI